MYSEPFSLGDRTTNFSKAILAFCKNEKPTFVTRPLLDQLIRAATSVGANYAEANNASSKTDFRNKIFIAKKEATEAKYWLALLEDLVENKTKCIELQQECHYLLMTFQKIVSSLNHSKRITENVQ